MRLPAPITVVFLVAALCAALLADDMLVAVFIGLASAVELLIVFLSGGRDGLG